MRLLSFPSCRFSGFAEAVGDTLALSVVSLKHMEAFGLLKDNNDPEVSFVLVFVLLKPFWSAQTIAVLWNTG